MCWRIPSKHSFHPLCMCLVTHGQNPCDDATPGSEVSHVQVCWGCHNNAFLHSILCNTPSPMVTSLSMLDRHGFGKNSVYQVYQRFPDVGILANTYTVQTSASPGSFFPAWPLSPSPVYLLKAEFKRAARGWVNPLKPLHVEGGTNICSVGLATRLLAASDMGCVTVFHPSYIYGGICHKWMHVTLYGYWLKWGQSYVSSNCSTKASVKL